MKVKYYFSVLRYAYDPLTQEFVNIGVVVYAPGHDFIAAECTSHYSRISKMFRRVDGPTFRGLTRYIEHQVERLRDDLSKGALFQDASLESILSKILPDDESAIRFSPGGAGITDDPQKALSALYERYVARYESSTEIVRRDDEDVWRIFRDPMVKTHAITRLVPKKITAPNYEYEFQHSWKNGVWHLYEPISFDLADPNSLLDKANRWLGRATNLYESQEAFKLFLLLGEPTDQKLKNSFIKAQNILNKIPGKKEFIRESDAEGFAEEVAAELASHPDEPE